MTLQNHERNNMTLFPQSVCGRCRNLKQKDVMATFTCKAFPKGIPSEILVGKVKHDKKRDDQKNDVVFEEYDFEKHFTKE